MKIISARDPHWSNAEQTMILLTVNLEDDNGAQTGDIPFGASADDTEVHGRLLFAEAKNGTYGVMKPYAAPDLDDDQKRAAFVEERAKAVAAIVVTTSSGQAFDGDEVSQGRMARTIVILDGLDSSATSPWVLHDNTVIQVGAKELREALTLAGQKQNALWVQP